MPELIVLGVVALFVLVTLAKSVRIVPQARAGVVERLGRYSRTLTPGLALVVPFVDRIRPLLDLREQVVSFDPQPVITGWGSNETTCSRRSRSGRMRSTNGTTRARPGVSVRL